MEISRNEKAAKELGLSDEEYRKILKIMGREPTLTEIAMFSVEWSEHCGYPHSRTWFELFPREGKLSALVGEDAGGIIHDGVAVVFKMESHNHPSQVEPLQGAATGIGGIIRDIFGAGARPIALLDSLRFGPLDDVHSRHVFEGVVDGIAFYGNCVGVPTVGGELYFHPSFRGNCLVNVMCVGIAPRDRLARAWAKGRGNLIIYAGNRTGRDGIGGCSILASQEFGEGDEKRPSVQVGDPFTEKCLIEATLEALDSGKVVGIKDMGAAGLTCSSSEMAAEGKSGMLLDLDRIPLRESGMEPWESMMSESQERMLLCVENGTEAEVMAIFHKWGLEAVVVGEVEDGDTLTVSYRGDIVAQIPARELTSPPVYTPPRRKPAFLEEKNNGSWRDLPGSFDWNEVILRLTGSSNLSSRRPVYRQYDHMVGINTKILPGRGTPVLRVKGKEWGIALTTDCNPVYCSLDPRLGAAHAVAEAARNLASSGARPAGVTDCLNFGNPRKDDRYWYFVEAVHGLSDACRALELPVVSGNVSFYNENPGGSVHPTPTVGMVGIIDRVENAVAAGFMQEDCKVIIAGDTREELGGSEYLCLVHDMEVGPPPSLDLQREKDLQEFLLEVTGRGLVVSASDLAEGGLVMGVVEACLCPEFPLGAELSLEVLGSLREDALLFGESAGRALLSVEPSYVQEVEETAQRHEIPLYMVGVTGGDRLIAKRNSMTLFDLSIKELRIIWEEGLFQSSGIPGGERL